ncbi:MAG: hypothetical protein RRZ84_08545 [Romboutsia sp.]
MSKILRLILPIIIVVPCIISYYNINEIKQTFQTNNNQQQPIDNNDYTVLVSSSTYNAVVSLDNNKELNIKLLETNSINNTSTDKYINFTDEDINYLRNNSDILIQEFKNCNLFEKYDLISSMLSKYDTNLKESDLIKIAMSYLQ